MRASRLGLRPRPARSGGVFFGRRLAADGGLDTLLEALRLFPGARVHILEEGAEDRRDRMRRAAYLVLPAPTCTEMPRALVEAFATGLPVIASRAGVHAELVEPGRNGLLFEPGAAPDLARRLAWAEAFPERMRQMGECAKADYQARFVADFSFPRLFGERRRAARL